MLGNKRKDKTLPHFKTAECYIKFHKQLLWSNENTFIDVRCVAKVVITLKAYLHKFTISNENAFIDLRFVAKVVMSSKICHLLKFLRSPPIL